MSVFVRVKKLNHISKEINKQILKKSACAEALLAALQS